MQRADYILIPWKLVKALYLICTLCLLHHFRKMGIEIKFICVVFFENEKKKKMVSRDKEKKAFDPSLFRTTQTLHDTPITRY
jgi:hypothetical protein